MGASDGRDHRRSARGRLRRVAPGPRRRRRRRQRWSSGPFSFAWFAVRGVGYSVEVMTGLDRLPTGRLAGAAVVVLLGAIALRRTHRGRRRGLAIGCLVGLVSMYALIGVARADVESDYRRGAGTSTSPPSSSSSPLPIFSRAEISWRILENVAARILAASAVLLVAWVIAVNVNSLFAVRTQFQHQADVTRAIIELSIEHRGRAVARSQRRSRLHA